MMKGVSLPFKYLFYIILLVFLLLFAFFFITLGKEKLLGLIKQYLLL